jgi:hypothetical protein
MKESEANREGARNTQLQHAGAGGSYDLAQRRAQHAEGGRANGSVFMKCCRQSVL